MSRCWCQGPPFTCCSGRIPWRRLWHGSSQRWISSAPTTSPLPCSQPGNRPLLALTARALPLRRVQEIRTPPSTPRTQPQTRLAVPRPGTPRLHPGPNPPSGPGSSSSKEPSREPSPGRFKLTSRPMAQPVGLVITVDSAGSALYRSSFIEKIDFFHK